MERQKSGWEGREEKDQSQRTGVGTDNAHEVEGDACISDGPPRIPLT